MPVGVVDRVEIACKIFNYELLVIDRFLKEDFYDVFSFFLLIFFLLLT